MSFKKEQTPPPPAEQSLKYIAWSLKEISAELKKLNDHLSSKDSSTSDQRDVPF